MSRYTRAQWGARHRAGFGSRTQNYPLPEVWGHHTVTSPLTANATFAQECAQMRIIENIGQQRFGGGISYSFLFFLSGRAYHGLGASRIGAHTGGRNSISISFAFVGNYENDMPTAAQLGAAAQCLKDLRDQGIIRHPRFNGGHRDAPGHAANACPGRNLHPQLSVINSQAAGSTSSGGSGTTPSAPSTPSTGVAGRFLRITADERANIRSAPNSTRDNVVGRVARGHLVRRDSSRDTQHFYGVGGRWFVSKTVATPVRAEASCSLVVGDWPGRNHPVNGNNTYELNRSWQELLARIGIQKGNRTAMWQRWLKSRGYDPGLIDGIEGPLTISALQRYLNDNVTRPAGVAPLVVDGVRGALTRAMEKRFLNRQIDHLGSKWPQHYRHTP